MNDLPSPIEVQSWAQAVAFIAFLLVVIALPSLLTYLGNRRVKNVEKTLTQNGGANHPPTVADKLHALADGLERVEATQADHGERLARLEEKPKKRKLFG